MKKLILPLMMAALLLSGCAAKKDETTPTTQAANGDMVIMLSDIGAEPTFIDGKIGDAPMQVIAIRDADGTVRLSYNTCQICQGSPWAFFEEQNGGLVCQNGQLWPILAALRFHEIHIALRRQRGDAQSQLIRDGQRLPPDGAGRA